MLRYTIRRILIAIPMLLVITIIIFSLAKLLPGDAVSAIMSGEGDINAESMRQMRENLGLNDTAFVQYIKWLFRLLTGDLGTSHITFTKVSEMIGVRLGPTILLMGTSLVVSILIGVTLGIISAMKQYSILDNILTVFAFLGRSVPVFFVGMFLIYYLALINPVFPTNGMVSIGANGGFKDVLWHMFLPALSLSVLRIAEFLRYSRASMLEVLNSDYVWTARSKGIKERNVIVKHALRNALIPIVTLIGLNIPVLFSGAMIIEQVFQWPGLGSAFNNAITQRDYPLLMGLCFISSIIVLLSNLVTDLAYAFVDPRIRYQ
ncbi:MAG: ABC transporter permease [Sphaerochaetaceae bacterium]|nr:ABC transporter permease [Sphaerochaetaceae bacterium]NLO61004.1 ABC transporter permease [Spirochaetales bacterium]MDD2406562.1 ABC transporter permease [Sphaerochaetaceae bacterium]MDD3670045.1 ABC transporter permease [Sphaerochaetaceae bacterium]MDD4259841.1 ABC transporter permease [Sphaerochaetaceae bacterium]